MPSATSSTGWSARYYANEDLKLTDNLRFGNQYGRFATCRIVSPGGLSPFYNPRILRAAAPA